jgi:hypothetical protein
MAALSWKVTEVAYSGSYRCSKFRAFESRHIDHCNTTQRPSKCATGETFRDDDEGFVLDRSSHRHDGLVG